MKKINLLSLIMIMGIFTFAQERKDVSANDFKQLLSSKNGVLIDVRTSGEFSGGHIEGAGNLDFYDPSFKQRIDLIKKDNVVFVYCLTGARSRTTANYLATKGVEVYNLQKGILEWKAAGLPVQTNVATPVEKKQISEQEYKNAVNSSKVVLVDFYAPWCGPCKKMSPIIDEIKSMNGSNIIVHKINIDENSALAKELKIGSIPLFYLYKNGKKMYEKNGTMTKSELQAEINKLLK